MNQSLNGSGVTGQRLVGYQTRLENEETANCQITYCTTGIFLNSLMEDDSCCLKGLTHIIVDQVHEKDRFVDVLLGVLRLRLLQYPPLRLVLISANDEPHSRLLARYFEPLSTTISIEAPSKGCPAAEYFLEEMLHFTRSDLG